ncbi:hypothetical protein EFV37_31640 [Mesorhizobium loti]|uniref:hypothetical protein n=1 Tax=Mesorhizobium TaxID=68287 RepID=UPI0003627068|nr:MULTISPECIES: hypothetical protein [Mesorhizobium]ANN60702.1 hypothetical protein A9174_31015 [Mesorhizobium loti NZP2037]OBP81288.1 hypothetical protein BAE41_06075 [Mesorhizobium loti]OBP88384.1 hypothetical protein BAE38_14335 [Mesorhizobium loti]OBQ69343.1 hypothetical protein A9K72_14435 [Mesorhizobium loti]QKC66300.1 hypothetical protein EB229_31630 [Mesorhizobium jarvisii]
MTGGTTAPNSSIGIKLGTLIIIATIVGIAAFGLMMVLFLFLFLLFSICRRSSPTKNAGRVDHPPENYRGQSG